MAARQALWSPDAALASGGGLSELGPGGARLGRARPASGRFWSKAWSTARAVASLLLGTSPRGKQGLGRRREAGGSVRHLEGGRQEPAEVGVPHWEVTEQLREQWSSGRREGDSKN